MRTREILDVMKQAHVCAVRMCEDRCEGCFSGCVYGNKPHTIKAALGGVIGLLERIIETEDDGR